MGQLITVLHGLIGLVILGVAALRPKRFWTLLIIITVGAAGLMVPQLALPLVDEYFLACLLVGSLMAFMLGGIRLRRRQSDVWESLHRWMFLLLIGYMVVQSFRGLMLWDDIRISRWIVYYLMLGMLSFIISRSDLPAPDMKKASSLVMLSALVYFAAYLAHGFYNQIFRGLSYATTGVQGVEWSGTAYAVFPLVVAVPATIIIFKHGSRKQRWMGWLLIIAALMVGALYDCRSAWIVVAAFFFVSLFMLRIRQIAVWLAVVLCIAMFFYASSAWLAQLLARTAALQYGSDAGRRFYTQIALEIMSSDLRTLFFGYGIHSHHFVMTPYLHSYGYGLGMSYMRVSGAAGLLVDTGLFGILLLGMNFLLVARKIIVGKKSLDRYIFLMALFFTLMWPVVGKIEDIVLFFLLIMPSGLLIQLSKSPRREIYLVKFSSVGQGCEI